MPAPMPGGRSGPAGGAGCVGSVATTTTRLAPSDSAGLIGVLRRTPPSTYQSSPRPSANRTAGKIAGMAEDATTCSGATVAGRNTMPRRASFGGTRLPLGLSRKTVLQCVEFAVPTTPQPHTSPPAMLAWNCGQSNSPASVACSGVESSRPRGRRRPRYPMTWRAAAPADHVNTLVRRTERHASSILAVAPSGPRWLNAVHATALMAPTLAPR